MAWFSVVIITKNEEKDIERCLNSVDGLTDDIVVADSFSTDKTREICSGFGVRFLEKEFLGYGATKNWANEEAKYDYILSLDADEALSDELFDSIKAIPEKDRADAYRFNRKTSYCGGWVNHCGWYPDTKMRLWNKKKGKWSDDLVHEDIILESDTTTRFLKGDILHYTFYTIEQHLGQINKFSSLKAKADYLKGKKAFWFKILFSPPVKFFKMYFLKLGFLDGWRGYVICRNSAFSTYLRYAKLRQLHKIAPGDEN